MIYVNNENKINILKEKINKHNVCVFMDYDKTMTSNESEDSWDVIANKKVMGEAISNDANTYYEKYGFVEFNYNMNEKEREKYIIKWYDECMDLYYQYGLTKEKLKLSIHNSKIVFREGVKELLFQLYKQNIPVIILSAGIGNVIQEVLKDRNCYYENITIISNFIQFNEKGEMVKFSNHMIHSLNKNIDKVENPNIKEMIKNKEYRIVIGDLVEDIHMMGNYEEEKSLKIGFLNKNIKENLEIYKKNFDIVLTKENNFYDIEKYIIQKN